MCVCVMRQISEMSDGEVRVGGQMTVDSFSWTVCDKKRSGTLMAPAPAVDKCQVGSRRLALAFYGTALYEALRGGPSTVYR